MLGAVAAVLVGFIVLVGCGTASGPATWVATDQTGALIVTWTNDSGALTGSIQSANPSTAGDGDPTTGSSASFTGVLKGGQVSLSVGSFLGITSTWTGSVEDEHLTLSVPQADGTIAAVVLAQGTVDDFNAAVATIADGVAQGRAAAAAVAAKSAATAALADVNGNLADAVAALHAALDEGVSFAEFETDMSTLRDDLQTTIDNAAAAKASGGESDACSEAGRAQSDAGGVESDAGGIESDAGGMEVETTSLSALASAVSEAFTASAGEYAAQGLAVPTTEGAPGSAVLAEADAAVSAWSATANSYVATAKDLASQATAAANSAYDAVC